MGTESIKVSENVLSFSDGYWEWFIHKDKPDYEITGKYLFFCEDREALRKIAIEELDFTEDSLRARIDSQYYIDRTVPDEQYNEMITKAPEFLVKCKSILIKLNEKKIKEIRSKFQSEIKKNG